MTEFLDLDDLLDIAHEAVGGDAQVGDYGLLESALARPRASVFGQDAYPDLHLKAAALLHSLARNHALVDGNKRLGWTSCLTFLAINGQWINAPEDERFEFVIRVDTGVLGDLDKIAAQLRAWSYQGAEPRSGRSCGHFCTRVVDIADSQPSCRNRG
jgi:death-on-curing protein